MTESKKYSFFLGCVMPNRFPNAEKSIRTVMPELGVQLEDLQGASCCPAPGVIRSFNEPTWLALASRNIALAEMQGNDIVTGCNGCYGTFKEALNIIRENPEKLKEVQRILKKSKIKYKGEAEAKHILELILEVPPEEFQKKVKKPLEGLRVAVHYGCHLLKPSKLRPWEKTQRHKFLDSLVELTGAESVKYKDKYMCCGAGGGVRGSNVPVSVDIAKEKLDNMLDAQADILINACSFCHLQFEVTQAQLNKELGEKKYQLPVFYITQLLGLAMGIDPDELGLHKHVVSTQEIIDRILE
ncbi:MAG: CoB--CoM heterodisulfide reductase subunit B [Candidatus Lokiarchaeota archaeon]|nr:CoB--CoM heterodisulfide reductase subunit B [Candidatus Lokiarchaeota archaeon]